MSRQSKAKALERLTRNKWAIARIVPIGDGVSVPKILERGFKNEAEAYERRRKAYAKDRNIEVICELPPSRIKGY